MFSFVFGKDGYLDRMGCAKDPGFPEAERVHLCILNVSFRL